MICSDIGRPLIPFVGFDVKVHVSIFNLSVKWFQAMYWSWPLLITRDLDLRWRSRILPVLLYFSQSFRIVVSYRWKIPAIYNSEKWCSNTLTQIARYLVQCRWRNAQWIESEYICPKDNPDTNIPTALAVSSIVILPIPSGFHLKLLLKSYIYSKEL